MKMVCKSNKFLIIEMTALYMSGAFTASPSFITRFELKLKSKYCEHWKHWEIICLSTHK